MITTKGFCRLRFYFFINGPPATVSSSKLQIFVRYARKKTKEAISLADLQLNAKEDLQQKWSSFVVQLNSADPFQFVFTGLLADNATAIAVDDITYNTNCLPSKVSRVTTTVLPPVTVSDQPSTVTTQEPAKHYQKPSNSSKGLSFCIFITIKK